MKYLLYLLLSMNILHADIINSKYFSAEFTQTIKDEKDKIIKYEGKIYAKDPNFAKWEYINPIKKSIFINYKDIYIVEPEIEQVIMKTSKEDINIFKILKKAKKINENLYISKVNNREVIIKLKDNIIKYISYTDEMENKVKISFKNIKTKKINQNIFKPIIPDYFDFIRG